MAHVEDRWTIPGPNGRRVRGPRCGVGSRWQAVWFEASGQRRRKSFTTKDAATAHLERIGVDRRAGSYVSLATSAVTLRGVAERWYLEQVHQRAPSLQAIRHRLDRTILPSLGDVPWSKVDRGVVQAAVTSWTASLAPAPVRGAYVYVFGICALAVDDRRVPATPCRRINLPPVEREPVVPYSIERVQALTDAAAERYRPLFVLAAASGLRSGELRGLTWDRVDDVDGGAVLRIDRQPMRAASAGVPVWGPPKSRPRHVSVGRVTREALGEPGAGLVFTTTSRGAITHEVAWQVWRASADVVGAPAREGWYELGLFHASLLIAGGASPVAVAHRLGHRDATETLETYAHLWPDGEERMRGATDDLIRLKDVAP